MPRTTPAHHLTQHHQDCTSRRVPQRPKHKPIFILRLARQRTTPEYPRGPCPSRLDHHMESRHTLATHRSISFALPTSQPLLNTIRATHQLTPPTNLQLPRHKHRPSPRLQTPSPNSRHTPAHVRPKRTPLRGRQSATGRTHFRRRRRTMVRLLHSATQRRRYITSPHRQIHTRHPLPHPPGDRSAIPQQSTP